jgi:hypothetical protein
MILTGRKRMVLAVSISVISALIVVAAAVSFFPRSTPTQSQCLGNDQGHPEPPSGLACPYIDAWQFQKSGVFEFQVENEGPTNITLSTATILGYSNNTGFTSSVTFNLNGTVLSPNTLALFTSPVLQNLQLHDNITVIIRCTNGVYSAEKFGEI